MSKRGNDEVTGQDKAESGNWKSEVCFHARIQEREIECAYVHARLPVVAVSFVRQVFFVAAYDFVVAGEVLGVQGIAKTRVLPQVARFHPPSFATFAALQARVPACVCARALT